MMETANHDVQKVIMPDHLNGERWWTQQLNTDVHNAIAHCQLVMDIHQYCRHECIVLHVTARKRILTAGDNDALTACHTVNECIT